MAPTIYLVLTDDWELRGDGSGDIEKIQFQPMRELVRLYEKYGVRGTFFAEMMQQLAFRKYQAQHPELRSLADSWDAHVVDAYERGHDIQLHLHTRWSNAHYEKGRWHVSGDWSILHYGASDARAMILAGKEYLENLLCRVDSGYQCLAFRAGALAIAPSAFLLNTLADCGIVLDASLVGGLRVETRNLQFDNTSCDESFVPFYPRMDDARRVSERREKIICLPIHQFWSSRRRAFVHVAALTWRKLLRHLQPADLEGGDGASPLDWEEVKHSSKPALVYDKAIKPCLKGKHMVSDFSRLNRPFMCEMLQDIRRRAAVTGLTSLPIVLTNHSKYMMDFDPLEGFLGEATGARDIKFLTLTEVAAKLRTGEFATKRHNQKR